MAMQMLRIKKIEKPFSKLKNYLNFIKYNYLKTILNRMK